MEQDLTAYSGQEPYIFISYAHKNAEIVLPILSAMQEAGFRLWFDRGIEAGSEWSAYIQDQLVGCTAFIIFLSKASVDSRHCREELGLARDANKEILVVYIEDLLPEDLIHGLRLWISCYQSLFLSRYADLASLTKALTEAALLLPCRGNGQIVRAPAEPLPPSPQPQADVLLYQPTVDGRGYAVTGVATPIPTEITIPPTYRGKPVLAIGDDAFAGCVQLQQIHMPAGLLSVGERAFQKCVSLRQITLPSSVTEIGASVFERCTALLDVSLSAGITRIPTDAFWGCASLRSIKLPQATAEIEPFAFFECCELADIAIPGGTTHIGKRAFAKCSNLRDVTLPTGVVSLGEGAFDRCVSLRGIALPSGLREIAASTFNGCVALTALTLPAGVTHIGNKAFWGCRSMTGITLPDALQAVGDHAFGECTALQELSLPPATRQLGICALAGCVNLHRLRLPAALDTIGESALENCASLLQLCFDGTTQEWSTVQRHSGWIDHTPLAVVTCANGTERL